MSAPLASAPLAIDFGTSNSAAAMLAGGQVRRLAIEPGAETLPTAVFFPEDRSAMRIGSAAAEALIAGEEGRYMRALKSVLGTPLFHEARPIGGKRRTLAEIVTGFLAELKARAEADAGIRFDRVLSGRPVHFHSADPARDAAAEADLRGCYEAAGFHAVDFRFEPEAAALAARADARADELGLIVDIGGGTSDFSVFRAAPGGIEILASHGIRLGGTDFDHAVSMAHAMPLLGLGGELRRSLGEGLLPVPKAIYVDLSTWAMIPFLYTRETERAVADMERHAVDAAAMGRLGHVIGARLGHELAFAVEAGKIAANGGGAAARIEMGRIERGLGAPITAGSLNAALAPCREPLRMAIYETLMLAQARPDQIGAVVLVGGSSLMGLVEAEARAVCPGAALRRSEAFTAVVDGLALATAEA
ncbi:hsp70 family protein [Rhodovulum sulfidophilum]|uniref:Hsp70 family protein n=1 Tax=Rhodovulum visakhapatnamense TaxID=364297 RepID=A0ABS1RJ09_9RHOB|nr:Hsp70 family protein [Rhodovulum visakhapatnamense]MBL3568605.1 Hsp70 family protein [Rhodovulum visakhapatnamense]MBL3579639.1 Hsp70 family protein [Rhodovulum visakhapatnamense]OLS43829.1 hsp70 family protein [Rhodovulum sulfidophilum]